MQGYIKQSVVPFMTEHYNRQLEASMQDYIRAVWGLHNEML
jgi:hypothetical protein